MGEVTSKEHRRKCIVDALNSTDFASVSLRSDIAPLVSSMAKIRNLCIADLADPLVAFDCGAHASMIAVWYLTQAVDTACPTDFVKVHVRDTTLFKPKQSFRLHHTIQDRSRAEQKSLILHDQVSGLFIDLTTRQFCETTPSILISDTLSWWNKKVYANMDFITVDRIKLRRLDTAEVASNLNRRREWYGNTLLFDDRFK